MRTTRIIFGIIITTAFSVVLLNGISYAFAITVNAGNVGANWDKFLPQNITINTGESVMWTNPQLVGEPHTVTFIKNQTLMPPLASTFSIPNSTKIIPSGPLPNVEPIILPDPANPNNKLVLMDNARAYNPVVIDESGKNVTNLPPNANYTAKDNESFLNSGFIWPQGQAPPGAAPIFSFAITFEKPGKYDYFCALHPWMTGTITVK